MSLPLDDPRVQAAHGRLAPYAARAFEEAARFAHRLHADELTIEHLFASLLFDEESAAAQVALHAFADPETLATEMMALCPGITIVGSERCLPFSNRGVDALRAARARAAAERAERVEPAHVLAEALERLEPECAAAMRRAGATAPVPARPDAGAGGLADEGPLFRSFSNAAKRALGLAGHQAVRLKRGAVAPAHLVLGCLEADEDLRAACGLSASRARTALGDADGDPTQPAPRDVPPSPELLGFLEGQPRGAETLDLLAALLEQGEPELIQLFTRQKVNAALVARCRGAFRDPDAG